MDAVQPDIQIEQPPHQWMGVADIDALAPGGAHHRQGVAGSSNLPIPAGGSLHQRHASPE